jgi:hypothetical protein
VTSLCLRLALYPYECQLRKENRRSKSPGLRSYTRCGVNSRPAQCWYGGSSAHRHEVAEACWLALADAPRLLAYRGEREMAETALSRLANEDV